MAIGDNTKYGKVLAEWTIPEYIKYRRTLTWWIVAGGIGIALLIHALVTSNFLFVIILLLIGLIVFVHERRHPDDIEFMILEGGIAFGDRFYAYKELKSFWIIYEPPATKLLYLETDHVFRKELPIHLEEQNPLLVRKVLLNFLDEDLDREEESTEERLARLFRL
jgi:hypothetical protein